MGDTYAAIVPYGVAPESAQAVADLFVNYLIKRKIISGKLTECVLGMDSGYPPAHHYGQILVQADDYLPELSTNGVAIQLGRQVFNAGGADEIGCPNCGNNIVDTDWGNALEEWGNETGNDTVKCIICGTEASITEYKFKPDWAFGNLGFTFWNWGSEFTNEFIRDLEKHLGYKLNIVYGKL